ncbi:MAG TPA: hypothetical protein VF332_10320 [Vicinamibacterales bacterium]
MRPRRLLIVGTACVLALAVWVSRGVLAVADSAAWPRRVGLLPPPWFPIIVGTLLGVCLLRAKRIALLPLLIPAVLVLPWLPFTVPSAALIWTGRVIVWVWIATALALAVAAWPSSWSGAAVVRWVREPSRGSLVALGLAFVIYCAGARLVSDVIPGGDEPHYLVITQSLLRDGDLQIENNHRQGDYRAYFPGELRPDFLRRGTNGQIYSVHAPGLPALVLPAFAIAGYPGVVVFLAFLSALGTWLVWRAGYRLTGSPGAAWFGWASVALSTPFFFHAFTVYPDATGAVVIMAAITALLSFEAGASFGGAEAPPHGSGGSVMCGPGGNEGAEWATWRWILLGGALGLLPWLHTRYAGVAAVLGACLGLRLLGHRAYAKLAALLLLPALGAAAWFGSFYAIYGEFSPAAPYNHYTQSQLSNIPRGLPALLFDQQFGVLPNAPVYALALAGLVPLFRLRRRFAGEMVLLLVSYLLLVAAFHMWWGGWSAPARFMVPVLLMLGVPAAVVWSRAQAAGRAVAIAALTVTGLVTGTMTLMESGTLIFNVRDGFARWLEWATPVVDLPRALPSFFRDTPGVALASSAVWVVALALAALVLRVVARRVPAGGVSVRARLALATPATFAAAVMVAASICWAMSGVGGATPTTSELALLRAYDPGTRPIGVQSRPLRRLPAEQVPGRLALAVSERRPAAPDGPLMTLDDVPAGVYRLSPPAATAAQGTIELLIGRSREPIERWVFDPASGGGEHELRLPVGVNSVTITGDALARRSMPRIALEPVAVVPVSARLTPMRAARAARYNGMTAFSFGVQAYLEGPGLWVRGGVPVPLAFTGQPSAPVVRLLLRNCPVANRVTLQRRGQADVLALQPGEERVVELPADPTNGGVFVVVQTEHGYRPADVDAASRDLRYLGVWIQAVPVR